MDIRQGQINILNREQGGLEVVISLPITTTTEEPQNNTLDKIKQTLTGHFKNKKWQIKMPLFLLQKYHAFHILDLSRSPIPFSSFNAKIHI